MTDIERLVNEWIEHDKIVLAVDFDDTIFPYRHRSGRECKKTLKLVRWCVDVVGAYVVIHTSSAPDRYDEIREFCKKNNLEIHTINKNPISLPYGNQGKPYFNWQLCDRSGLGYAEVVLELAAKKVITIKRSKIKLDDAG